MGLWKALRNAVKKTQGEEKALKVRSRDWRSIAETANYIDLRVGTPLFVRRHTKISMPLAWLPSARVDGLGAGELRGTGDKTSSAARGDCVTCHVGQRRVVCPDRVGADRPRRTLSHASGGHGYLTRGRVLIAGTPRGR